MISRLLLLVICFTLSFSAPLAAAENKIGKVPSVYLLANKQLDSFDAEFEDDFDDAFDKDFADDFSTGKKRHDTLIADPLEPFNRGVFWVNDKLYFYLFKPVVRGYRFVVPRPARVSVGNFFSNLATPIRAANLLLQFKFYELGTEFYRFIVNTTVGIGGLFDPAASIAGVQKVEEDFGQTLGYYGLGHGFYLVLPILGPSSLRDGTGVFVDTYFDPLKYMDLSDREYYAIHGYKMINRLSLDKDTYEGIIRDALDPYLFIRAAYAQRRLAQIGRRSEGYDLDAFEENLRDEESVKPLNILGD